MSPCNQLASATKHGAALGESQAKPAVPGTGHGKQGGMQGEDGRHERACSSSAGMGVLVGRSPPR